MFAIPPRRFAPNVVRHFPKGDLAFGSHEHAGILEFFIERAHKSDVCLEILFGPLGVPVKLVLRGRHHQNVFHILYSFRFLHLRAVVGTNSRFSTSPGSEICLMHADKREGTNMTATLDWSQCPAVNSIPGKRSGAWVFRGTRMPISMVFENLEDMNVDELVEEFGVTREQVRAVLQFAAHSAESRTPRP
jgi:uncharacterized protein (DUF433 family)